MYKDNHPNDFAVLMKRLGTNQVAWQKLNSQLEPARFDIPQIFDKDTNRKELIENIKKVNKDWPDAIYRAINIKGDTLFEF